MEEWLPIKDFPEYAISSYGRVMSYKDPLHPVILKLQFNNQGYMRVELSRRPRYRVLVHRLVAQAFLFNGADYPIVNHKDRDRANNRVSNLEWCTQSENMIHWRADEAKKHVACVSPLPVYTFAASELPW